MDDTQYTKYDNLIKQAFVLGVTEHLKALGADPKSDKAMLKKCASVASKNLERAETYKQAQKEKIAKDILSLLK